MRKKTLKKIMCPNGAGKEFLVHGFEVLREHKILYNIAHADLCDDDDIKEGIIVDCTAHIAYPITQYVLSLLSDADADINHYAKYLKSSLHKSPEAFKPSIQISLNRLSASKKTAEGIWNQDEMAYYDKELDSEDKRNKFFEHTKTQPFWERSLERDRHLFQVANIIEGQTVLEIGCWDARTISCLANPAIKGFEYIGTDISLNSLYLAKMAIPEGEFIQCSAMNLPFKDRTFTTTLALGVLHHMHSAEKGFSEMSRVLKTGGYMMIHEAIEKQKFMPGGQVDWIKRLNQTYEHSEHDNEIDLRVIKAKALELNLDIVHEHYSISILRTVLSGWPMNKMLIQKSRYWWQFLIGIDNAFVRLFCQKPNSLGPAAVFLVLVKRCAKLRVVKE